MVNFNLNGKIALVTGASRGIGESIAKTLAAYGAEVVLASRKIDPLKEVASAITDAGGKAHPVSCHVGEPVQINSLYEEIENKYGRLDILINNAATNPYFGEMTGVDEGIWDKTFDVNVKGPFFMIQKAVPLMKKNDGGSIVNVSSVNGIKPAPFQGVYSITKASLISMTKAFAKELASAKIRVNALLPGLTETKFSNAIINNEGIYEYVVKQIPMGRHGQPDEMSGAVLYLASDASSFTTGSLIVCDGGFLA